ncbi:hypothetical protein [Microbacterium terrae]|uniref:hypothetical protein n=1 Tax=Microbacterium terrae TaxID=69369 RepID=UPI0012ED5B70|nr:hypothetical protein [Microbacterium terrae]
MSAIQSHWHRNLSGIDAYDEHVTVSFEQTARDVAHLRAAIAHLGSGDATAAAGELSEVGRAGLDMYFSPEVHRYSAQRYLQDHPTIGWGGQIVQPWRLDITPQIRQLEDGELVAAADGLREIADKVIRGVDLPGARTETLHIDGLDERLADAERTLRELTAMVGLLR